MNGADQNVTGIDDNVSNFTGTTQRRQLTRDRLTHDLESTLNEQSYNLVSFPATEKTFTSYLEKSKPRNNFRSQITCPNVYSSRGHQMQLNIINDKTGIREEA